MKYFLILFLLSIPTIAIGQEHKIDSIETAGVYQQPRIIRYKLDWGGGIGTGGMGSLLSIMFHKNNACYILRYSSAYEFPHLESLPYEEVCDYGILYGLSHKWRSEYYALGIGLSYVKLIRRGTLLFPGFLFFPSTYETVKVEGIGVPIQMEISHPFFSFFGMGLIGYVDINTIRTFFGCSISFEIGKVE